MIIQIDNGPEVPVEEFVKENTGDVFGLSETEINKICSLEIGDECYIGSQGGYTSIKRVA